MAVFWRMKTKGTLRATLGQRAFFSTEDVSYLDIEDMAKDPRNDTALVVHFYMPHEFHGLMERHPELYGMTLPQFQEWLNHHGGSILVSIKDTKDCYVSIETRSDAELDAIQRSMDNEDEDYASDGDESEDCENGGAFENRNILSHNEKYARQTMTPTTLLWVALAAAVFGGSGFFYGLTQRHNRKYPKN